MKTFYLIAAIIGTIAPWTMFHHFFFTNGFDLPLFIQGLFANGAAAGFSTDVMLSIGIFWVWSYVDARRHGVDRWSLVLPAGCLVGLSLALPLYLYLREDHRT